MVENLEKNKKSNIKRKKKKNQVQALNLLIFMLFNIILLISISANAVYTGSNLTVIRTSQEGTGESVIFNWEENVLQNTESFSEYNIDNNPYGYLDEHDATLTRDYANSSDFYTEGVGSSVVETNYLGHDTVLNFTQDGGYPRGTLTPSSMNKSCWNETIAHYTFDGDVGGYPSGWEIIEGEDTGVEVVNSFQGRNTVVKISDNSSINFGGMWTTFNSLSEWVMDFYILRSRAGGSAYIRTYPGFYIYAKSGNLYYLDPNLGEVMLKSGLSLDTWYHFKVICYDDTKTYDLEYNGNVWKDLPYKNMEEPEEGITKFIIDGTGSQANYDIYVDDVKIYVEHCDLGKHFGTWDFNDDAISREGYYYGSWDFNDEEIKDYSDNPTELELVDSGDVDSECSLSILEEKYGHKNVLELYDNNTAGVIDITKNIPLTPNIVMEFWWAFNTTEGYNELLFILYESETRIIEIRFNYVNVGRINVHNGTDSYPIVSGLSTNTFYHVKLELDDSNNQFEFFLNGESKGIHGYKNDNENGIDSIFFYTRANNGGGAEMYHWLDAIGIVEINNYDEGDNINPYGKPEEVSSSINEAILKYNTSVSIIRELDRHKNVLQIYDKNSEAEGNIKILINFSTISNAIFDIYIARSCSSIFAFQLYENDTVIVRTWLNSDDLYYRDSTNSDHIIASGFNQWNHFYHYRFVLNDTSNQFDAYVNGVLKKSDLEYNNAITNGINNIRLFTVAGIEIKGYVDAIGIMGRNNYTSWDNMNPYGNPSSILHENVTQSVFTPGGEIYIDDHGIFDRSWVFNVSDSEMNVSMPISPFESTGWMEACLEFNNKSNGFEFGPDFCLLKINNSGIYHENTFLRSCSNGYLYGIKWEWSESDVTVYINGELKNTFNVNFENFDKLYYWLNASGHLLVYYYSLTFSWDDDFIYIPSQDSISSIIQVDFDSESNAECFTFWSATDFLDVDGTELTQIYTIYLKDGNDVLLIISYISDLNALYFEDDEGNVLDTFDSSDDLDWGTTWMYLEFYWHENNIETWINGKKWYVYDTIREPDNIIFGLIDKGEWYLDAFQYGSIHDSDINYLPIKIQKEPMQEGIKFDYNNADFVSNETRFNVHGATIQEINGKNGATITGSLIELIDEKLKDLFRVKFGFTIFNITGDGWLDIEWDPGFIFFYDGENKDFIFHLRLKIEDGKLKIYYDSNMLSGDYDWEEILNKNISNYSSVEIGSILDSLNSRFDTEIDGEDYNILDSLPSFNRSDSSDEGILSFHTPSNNNCTFHLTDLILRDKRGESLLDYALEQNEYASYTGVSLSTWITSTYNLINYEVDDEHVLVVNDTVITEESAGTHTVNMYRESGNYHAPGTTIEIREANDVKKPSFLKLLGICLKSRDNRYDALTFNYNASTKGFFFYVDDGKLKWRFGKTYRHEINESMEVEIEINDNIPSNSTFRFTGYVSDIYKGFLDIKDAHGGKLTKALPNEPTEFEENITINSLKGNEYIHSSGLVFDLVSKIKIRLVALANKTLEYFVGSTRILAEGFISALEFIERFMEFDIVILEELTFTEGLIQLVVFFILLFFPSIIGYSFLSRKAFMLLWFMMTIILMITSYFPIWLSIIDLICLLFLFFSDNLEIDMEVTEG